MLEQLVHEPQQLTGNVLGPDLSNEGSIHGVSEGTPFADPCQARWGVLDWAGTSQPGLQESGHLQDRNEVSPHAELSDQMKSRLTGLC